MGLSNEHYRIAKENGISKQLAYQRYECLFWTVEDAITNPVRRESDEYKNWKAVALVNGLSYVGFWRRIKQGMTPEQAATAPKCRPWQRKEKREGGETT